MGKRHAILPLPPPLPALCIMRHTSQELPYVRPSAQVIKRRQEQTEGRLKAVTAWWACVWRACYGGEHVSAGNWCHTARLGCNRWAVSSNMASGCSMRSVCLSVVICWWWCGVLHFSSFAAYHSEAGAPTTYLYHTLVHTASSTSSCWSLSAQLQGRWLVGVGTY